MVDIKKINYKKYSNSYKSIIIPVYSLARINLRLSVWIENIEKEKNSIAWRGWQPLNKPRPGSREETCVIGD